MKAQVPLQILSSLDSIEFFAGLDENSKNDVLACASVVEYDEGAYLFFQGDPSEAMFVVLEGRIRLTQVNQDGEQVIHHYPGPGEAFGLVAVLRSIDFPVTAQSVEPSRALMWDKATIQALMLKHPQLGLNAINILSKFIVDFQERIQQLSTENVERRIAHSLLRLANQAGKENEHGEILIDIKITRKEISEMAGTTLFTVSRLLSKWEKEELLNSKSQYLLLKRPDLLKEIAREEI